METGPQSDPFVAEPLEDPFEKRRQTEPAPEPARPRQPVPVP